MKTTIKIILGIIILFLGYKCYESISVPQKFEILKKHRYDIVKNRLIDIRKAQEAYKSVYDVYTHSFDTLINFIKYDSIRMVRSIGSLSDEQIEADMTESEAIKKGLILRDTIKVAALENVFSEDFPIEDIRYVPFTNKTYEFIMGATVLTTKSGIDIPVFEARVSNTIIFKNIYDKYKMEIEQENGERIRLKKYPGMMVGSLKEANNNVGNWE